MTMGEALWLLLVAWAHLAWLTALTMGALWLSDRWRHRAR